MKYFLNSEQFNVSPLCMITSLSSPTASERAPAWPAEAPAAGSPGPSGTPGSTPWGTSLPQVMTCSWSRSSPGLTAPLRDLELHNRLKRVPLFVVGDLVHPLLQSSLLRHYSSADEARAHRHLQHNLIDYTTWLMYTHVRRDGPYIEALRARCRFPLRPVCDPGEPEWRPVHVPMAYRVDGLRERFLMRPVLSPASASTSW